MGQNFTEPRPQALYTLSGIITPSGVLGEVSWAWDEGNDYKRALGHT